MATECLHTFDEKLVPLNLSSPDHPPSPRPNRASHPQLVSSRPVSSHCARSSHPSRYVRPRGLRIWNLFKQWSPVLAYGATSLGFFLAIAFWKSEVFGGDSLRPPWSPCHVLGVLLVSMRMIQLFEMDSDLLSLSLDTRTTTLANSQVSINSRIGLRNDEYFGYAVLFCLIFITTFPPLPLYSTLITLSGYTFGPWIGAVISYSAALSGAIVVFSLSRTFLREPIARWLQSTRGLCRAVRAIERKPSLLFLVRLAPYPYNVLNALLAATPTLEMKTYVICTALSLFKLQPDESSWSRVWTAGGIMLCVVLFIYISWIARRAVDDELEDEAEVSASASEERVAFLALDSPVDEEAELHPYSRLPPSRENMSEAHLTLSHPISAR
ncbi:hypothetical protein EV401DRAFT_2139531 [Pisolithus croceorrhizus]|nr:hypothetical protein EV401DRAFT_2139531 [Pisolithus croceorrhizus]